MEKELLDYLFEGQWPLIIYVTVPVLVVISLPLGTCPVLCSNNGEYEEGACRCYPGWKVSCDWWRAGHVTTIITSDWSAGRRVLHPPLRVRGARLQQPRRLRGGRVPVQPRLHRTVLRAR